MISSFNTKLIFWCTTEVRKAAYVQDTPLPAVNELIDCTNPRTPNSVPVILAARGMDSQAATGGLQIPS
jgi:hypothetical protein